MLNTEHPGHDDASYYERRVLLSSVVALNKHPMRFPPVVYTIEEERCWTQIYTRLEMLWPVYACDLFQCGLAILKSSELISATHIPDVQGLIYSTGYVRTPTCYRKIYYCPIILSYIDRHGNSPNPVVLFRVK